MATNDIVLHGDARFGAAGTVRYTVESGATAILPGEPCAIALGAEEVTQMATNKPVVATDFLAGIAMSTSTQTASADGFVDVMPLTAGQQFLITPNVAATWNTQAKYDELVGFRVLLDLTAGVFTILAADGATSGCVILPMTITDNPGKVLFTFRNGVSYLT